MARADESSSEWPDARCKCRPLTSANSQQNPRFTPHSCMVLLIMLRCQHVTGTASTHIATLFVGLCIHCMRIFAKLCVRTSGYVLRFQSGLSQVASCSSLKLCTSMSILYHCLLKLVQGNLKAYCRPCLLFAGGVGRNVDYSR